MSTDTSKDPPETLDEFLTAYEQPYQSLVESYSEDQDDHWAMRRHRTCIATPKTPAEAALREVAVKYYPAWRSAAIRWTQCRDAVLAELHADRDIDAPLAERGAAEEAMTALVRVIAGEEITVDRDTVQRVTNNPPVCNIGCLGADAQKGFLDVLWHAFVGRGAR